MKKSPSKYVLQSVNAFKRGLKTRRGRSFVLYLLCLGIALMFWVIITLDETTEGDYEVPVELVNVPDSVVLISDIPQSINVVIKGKGTQFLRYYLLPVPSMKIDFRQYTAEGSCIKLSQSKIDSKLREIFGQGVSIISVHPDSISLRYTSGSGYKLPLRINATVSASSQSIISGPVSSAIDSVRVYTINGEAPDFDIVETEELRCKDVSDSMICEVNIKKVPGTRIIPESVKVTIPAELLVSKKYSLPVKAINIPENARLITYPSTIEVSYLVPMSLSNQEIPARAIIDYNSLNSSSRYAAVNIEAMPGGYKIVSVSQDSVEYVIEK